ncbi:hypothetical protein [Nitrospira sp. M1]
MPRLSSITQHSIIVILCLCWAIPVQVFASEPNLRQFSATHQSALLTISSDNDALNFYKKYWPIPQDITRHHRTASRTQQAQEMTSARITLIANLLASRLAITMQSALQEQGLDAIQPFSDQQRKAHEWVTTKSIPPIIAHMLDFHAHVTDYVFKESTSPTRPGQFEAFAAYLDQQYPVLTGSEDSWVGLLEQGKLSNIDQRLSEYWEQPSAHNHALTLQSDDSSRNIKSYARYYIWTRLWPIYKSHLIALTIQAEMDAIQFARTSMTQMTMKQNTDSHEANQARLCGTWHWMVHNHQNHGDHKMTLFLGNPSKSPTTQPQPTEITIKGDTVYLLWKFPQGFQEDSLLLSQDDKRLEGTFHNTLGPHGSITGKRLSSCKP